MVIGSFILVYRGATGCWHSLRIVPQFHLEAGCNTFWRSKSIGPRRSVHAIDYSVAVRRKEQWVPSG